MTDSQTPTYRSHTTPDTPKSRYHEASGRSIELREDVEGEDGVFEIRMPIATTGEVRNQNDDPLTREELEGMAKQVGTGVVSVFPDHGKTDIGGPTGYSIMEKGGEWAEGEVLSTQEAESEEHELVATARLMDPDTLPEIPVRDMVGSIKELVKRDMSIPASIGWKQDENSPGGNDLMEASMVGIGADPRTVSDGSDAATVARAAVGAGADREELVATVREAVGGERDSEASQDMTDDDTPDGDGGTTEQDEQTDRAPDDVTPSDLATLVAASYDGVEASDLVDAWDDMGDFTGSVDTDALVSLVATTTGADADTVSDAMESLMDGDDEEEGEQEDKPDDYDEDDDEEQSADTDEESETDSEQSVDEDLAERIAELESALEDVRSGDDEVESPAGDDEPDEEQDADDASSDRTDSWRKHAHN